MRRPAEVGEPLDHVRHADRDHEQGQHRCGVQLQPADRCERPIGEDVQRGAGEHDQQHTGFQTDRKQERYGERQTARHQQVAASAGDGDHVHRQRHRQRRQPDKCPARVARRRRSTVATQPGGDPVRTGEANVATR